VPDEVAHEVPVTIYDLNKASEYVSKLEMQSVLVAELGTEYAMAAIFTLKELGLHAFPLGPGGKIQKPKVREVVLQFMSSGASELTVPLTNGNSNTLSMRIRDVVAAQIGVNGEDLDSSTCLSTLLDSLSSVRLANALRKVIGRLIPPAVIGNIQCLEDLVRLCDSSATNTVIDAVSSHEGPPQPCELMFLNDKSPENLEALQSTVQTAISPFEMTWQHHVQDILKVPFVYSLDLFEATADRGFLRRMFEVENVSSRHITRALGQWLEHYTIFRSFAIKFNGDSLLIRVRPCIQYRRACVSYDTIQPDEVEPFCDDQMKSAAKHACKPPDTLLNFQIVDIASTNKCLIVLSVTHALVDAAMMSTCLRDLDALLNNLDAPLSEDIVDYKPWADMYHNLEHSQIAQTSAAYQARMLQGFSALKDSVWPPLPDPAKASTVAGIGDYGSIQERRYEHLPALFTRHGIRPATVIKAAVALAVARETGKSHAMFVDANAGREWPFQDAFVQSRLPNAWDINGPTYTPLLNVINLESSADETCLQFLQRMHSQGVELAQHRHAPFPSILGKLGAEAALITAFFSRHTLNITPDVRAFLAYEGPTKTLMQKRVKAFTVSPGVYWQCSVANGDTFALSVRVDEDVVDLRKVEGMREDVFALIEELSRPGIGEVALASLMKRA
jgi:acyl carrier protein